MAKTLAVYGLTNSGANGSGWNQTVPKPTNIAYPVIFDFYGGIKSFWATASTTPACFVVTNDGRTWSWGADQYRVQCHRQAYAPDVNEEGVHLGHSHYSFLTRPLIPPVSVLEVEGNHGIAKTANGHIITFGTVQYGQAGNGYHWPINAHFGGSKPANSTVSGSTVIKIGRAKNKGWLKNNPLEFFEVSPGVTSPKIGTTYFVVADIEEAKKFAAAKAITAEDAIGAKKISLTGAKAAGFTNGTLVKFTEVSPGVTLPVVGHEYYIVEEAENEFGIAKEKGGTALAVAGAALKVASTKVALGEEQREVGFEISATEGGEPIKVEGANLEPETTKFRRTGTPTKEPLEANGYNATAPVQVKMPAGVTEAEVTKVHTSRNCAWIQVGPTTLYGWGLNNHAQVGTEVESPEGPTEYERILLPTKLPFAFPHEIVSMEGGENHSVCIDSTGNVYGWGRNLHGELGNEAGVGKIVKTPKLLAAGATAVVVTNEATFILKEGKLFGMGSGKKGVLGLGSEENKEVLTEVKVLGGVGPVLEVQTGANAVGARIGKVVYGWGEIKQNASGEIEEAKEPVSFASLLPAAGVKKFTMAFQWLWLFELEVENTSMTQYMTRSRSADRTKITIKWNTEGAEKFEISVKQELDPQTEAEIELEEEEAAEKGEEPKRKLPKAEKIKGIEKGAAGVTEPEAGYLQYTVEGLNANWYYEVAIQKPTAEKTHEFHEKKTDDNLLLNLPLQRFC